MPATRLLILRMMRSSPNNGFLIKRTTVTAAIPAVSIDIIVAYLHILWTLQLALPMFQIFVMAVVLGRDHQSVVFLFFVWDCGFTLIRSIREVDRFAVHHVAHHACGA